MITLWVVGVVGVACMPGVMQMSQRHYELRVVRGGVW